MRRDRYTDGEREGEREREGGRERDGGRGRGREIGFNEFCLLSSSEQINSKK